MKGVGAPAARVMWKSLRLARNAERRSSLSKTAGMLAKPARCDQPRYVLGSCEPPPQPTIAANTFNTKKHTCTTAWLRTGAVARSRVARRCSCKRRLDRMTASPAAHSGNRPISQNAQTKKDKQKTRSKQRTDAHQPSQLRQRSALQRPGKDSRAVATSRSFSAAVHQSEARKKQHTDNNKRRAAFSAGICEKCSGSGANLR